MKLNHVALVAAMLLGSATIAVGQTPAKQPPAPKPAASMKIMLNVDSCKKFNFGSIVCGEPYVANLSADRKNWSVTGKQVGGATVTAEYAATAPDVLVLWGLPLKMKGGDLLHEGAVVGRIVTGATPAKPAARPAGQKS